MSMQANKRVMAQVRSVVRLVERMAAARERLGGGGIAVSLRRPPSPGMQRARRVNAAAGAVSMATVGGGVAGGTHCPNARVVLVCEESAGLVPTRDVSDRAHAVFEVGAKGVPMLVPAGRSRRDGGSPGGARPRCYPRSQMTSRGVAFDSAYDELHERQGRLEGIMAGARAGASSIDTLHGARVQAGSAVIERNKRSYAVASVASVARGYARRGLISSSEAARLAGG